ncbi:MAG TPA: SDR family NAD(P)-dependent oxidoreductase [Xanthobacteraceae bacterium]|nr:SDR family NAD(P)-dependent oxidoreductase [Xanthobacteraceae bacterium]
MKMADLFKVEGHVAFVTGAASGLGLAYAEVMAQNGAKVVLADLNGEELERHVARLAAAGCAVEPVTLDVADTDALRAAIDGAAARHGRLDVLFANAGISAGRGTLVSPEGAIDRFDVEAFKRSIDVNMTATLMAMRFAVPHMKQRRTGSIVATASIAGIRAEPITGYGYIASKAAVINIVRQAAVELAPYNIRVNAIAPGPFYTNIGGGRLHRDAETVKLFADMVPLGRLAQTDEIKGLALLLASPAGSYITGTVIPIDGGATAVMTRGNYSTAAVKDGANV